jgi:hypothetical protein
MGPTALLPLRRKACWGFLCPKNPTKGQHATSRPPKPLTLSIVFYRLLLGYNGRSVKRTSLHTPNAMVPQFLNVSFNLHCHVISKTVSCEDIFQYRACYNVGMHPSRVDSYFNLWLHFCACIRYNFVSSFTIFAVLVKIISNVYLGTTIIIIIYLLTVIGLSPGGSGYFTCKQTWNSLLLNLRREGYMRSM